MLPSARHSTETICHLGQSACGSKLIAGSAGRIAPITNIPADETYLFIVNASW